MQELKDKLEDIQEFRETEGKDLTEEEAKVDDPSQSARAFYVSSSEPKD